MTCDNRLKYIVQFIKKYTGDKAKIALGDLKALDSLITAYGNSSKKNELIIKLSGLMQVYFFIGDGLNEIKEDPEKFKKISLEKFLHGHIKGIAEMLNQIFCDEKCAPYLEELVSEIEMKKKSKNETIH